MNRCYQYGWSCWDETEIAYTSIAEITEMKQRIVAGIKPIVDTGSDAEISDLDLNYP